MSTIDLLDATAGNLYCYRYHGDPSGMVSDSARSQVGTGGWDAYRSVFPAGNNFVYAIDGDGRLYWYRHDGQPDASIPGSGRKVVGLGGWHAYVAVFAAGENYIYAIDRKGNLHQYEHAGQQQGEAAWGRWPAGKVVSQERWTRLVSVCAVGNLIYSLDLAGNVTWHRHDGQQDGTDRWTEHPVTYTGDWGYLSIFAVGNSLYGIGYDGNLYWCRHDGQHDGSAQWAPRQLVGQGGWLRYRSVFATDNGTIYGVGLDAKSWMSAIPPLRGLNEFTIPGTHDSGTWPAAPGNSKCQTLSLKKQLDAGIRFIDIRVKQEDNEKTKLPDFGIYHGNTAFGSMGLWFSTDIVEVCKRFLAEHPTETIIMSVKDEWGSTDDFEQNLRRYLTPDICWSGADLPGLWLVRGRIVLVRRYEFATTGAPATMGIPARKDWPDDEKGFGIPVGDFNRLNIQDVYGYGFVWENFFSDATKREKIRKKWSFVADYLQRAAADGHNITWWINFASASGPPGVIDPVDFAVGNWGQAGVNSEINGYLKNDPSGHYGLVVMDFPEHPNHGEAIKRLIVSNFA